MKRIQMDGNPFQGNAFRKGWGGGGWVWTTAVPFDCAPKQVYFIIVFHTYNTRENSFHNIVSAFVLLPLSFVYEPFTTV